MGIGLSAQGVNMNRLPGKSLSRCFFSLQFVLNVHLKSFICMN